MPINKFQSETSKTEWTDEINITTLSAKLKRLSKRKLKKVLARKPKVYFKILDMTLKKIDDIVNCENNALHFSATFGYPIFKD